MDPFVVILWFLWDSLVLQDTLSKRFSNKGAVSVRNSFYSVFSSWFSSMHQYHWERLYCNSSNCMHVYHFSQQMALRFHMLSSEFLALLLYKSWSAADGFVDSLCEIMYYPYPMRNCYSQIIPLIHSWKVKKMAPTNDGLLKIFPFDLPIWSWSTDQTFDVDEEANFVSDADTCSALFFPQWFVIGDTSF